jgi:hypothetical protein
MVSFQPMLLFWGPSPYDPLPTQIAPGDGERYLPSLCAQSPLSGSLGFLDLVVQINATHR